MALGMVLLNACTVALAFCSGDDLSEQACPHVTMFGLSNVPSKKTWWSLNALYWYAKT